MLDATNTNLLEEVNRLRRRVAELERQQRDESNVTGPTSEDVIRGVSAEDARKRAHAELEQKANRQTEQLIAADEKWRSVVENAPDYIVIVNRDGLITFINRVAPSLNMDDVLGKTTIYEYTAPAHQIRITEALEAVFKRRESTEYEVYCPLIDSWFVSRMGPMQRDGDVVSAIILSRDVTKRKKDGQKLRDSEAPFRGYFELGLVGIAITSPEKGWIEVNDRLCEIFGYTRGELLQKTWPEITHPEDLAKTVEQFERVLAGEIDGYSLEKRFVRRDGTVIFGSVDVCLRLDDGGVDYFVVMIQDITGRKIAEQASHEKQAQLDNLLSNVDAIILEGDPFEIYYVGGQVEKILGYPKEMWFEHPGGPVGFWSGLLHPDDVDKMEICRQAIERGEDHTFEYRLIAKDGRPIWFYDSVMVETRDGEPVKTRSVMIDITERKRAEEALQESEARFRNFFENAPDANLLVVDGILIDCNQAALSMLRGSREQVIGFRPSALSPEFQPDGTLSADKAAGHLREAIETGSKLFEWVHRRFDGTEFWVEVAATAITYRGQRTLFGTWRDITDRKVIEESLLESQRYLSQAEAMARVGHWRLIPETGEIIGSDELFRIFGLSREEASLESFLDVVHPEDREYDLYHVQRGIDYGEDWNIEHRLLLKDGTVSFVQAIGKATVDETGKTVLLMGTVQDISARKQLEEKVRQHQEQLAHVARLSTMGEMATGLAHELNQPLAAITSYSYVGEQLLARTESADPERLRELFEKLTAQAMRAGEIIRRLRALVGKRTAVRSQVDVVEPIQEVLQLLETGLRQNEVRVELRTDHPKCVVSIDEIQIQQVLVNLIRNALDAMSETDRDRRTLKITTSPTAEGSIEVAVCDTGKGVPLEKKDQVFDAFFSTKSEGMGMGLAISRTIIESHGGRLWMTPNSDRGVTFHVTLPIAKEGSRDDGGQANGFRAGR